MPWSLLKKFWKVVVKIFNNDYHNRLVHRFIRGGSKRFEIIINLNVREDNGWIHPSKD
jgi:hypothetical protein